MGQRTVNKPQSEQPHTHEKATSQKPEADTIQVDAGKMIVRLQQQRAQLQQQLDFAEIAISDRDEQIQNLIARIAELEDKEK